MKPVKTTVALLVLLFFASCDRGRDGTISNVDDPVAIESLTNSNLTSMKGWELYSWQNSNGWYFALVEGTNRLKTFEEISAPAVAVLGWTALERKLSRLARGEQIFWSTGRVRGTSFPLEDRIRVIRPPVKREG